VTPTGVARFGPAGTVKLRRYVRALGFRRVGRTPFYGLSTSRKVPRFEDLLGRKGRGEDGQG
jgi:hypothetical protein